MINAKKESEWPCRHLKKACFWIVLECIIVFRYTHMRPDVGSPCFWKFIVFLDISINHCFSHLLDFCKVHGHHRMPWFPFQVLPSKTRILPGLEALIKSMLLSHERKSPVVIELFSCFPWLTNRRKTIPVALNDNRRKMGFIHCDLKETIHKWKGTHTHQMSRLQIVPLLLATVLGVQYVWIIELPHSPRETSPLLCLSFSSWP